MKFFIISYIKNQEDNETTQKLSKYCFLYFVFFIALLPILGCGGPKVWKIGLIAPMSGDYAQWGLLQFQAVRLAIQEFDEQYGQIDGQDVQLIVMNSQGETPLAEITRELIQKENIIGLLGPTFSSVGMIVADDFQKERIPILTIGTNPKITEKGDYIFRIMASDALVAKVISHYLVQELQLPNLAVLYTAEDAFSENLGQSVASDFQEQGGEVLINTGVPKGTTDFRPYLEELTVPSAIYMPFYTVDFSQALAQIRKDPRYQNTLISGSDTIINKNFLKAAGDLAEGVIVAADSPSFTNKTRHFEALYKVIFGTKTNIYATYIYDGTFILLDALRKTYQIRREFDANTFRQEIHNTSYTGASGKIEFAANGDAKRNVAISEIRDGRFEKQDIYTIYYDKVQKVWE